MRDKYKIDGAKDSRVVDYLDTNAWCPEFQSGVESLKRQLIEHVSKVKGGVSQTYLHFNSGDYYFYKMLPIGNALPGKRCLSVPYDMIEIDRHRDGWIRADYHCVECLEPEMTRKHAELYPQKSKIPMEFIYGLVYNRWLFRTFGGRIGIIGASEKVDLIESLMAHRKYQRYLGLRQFGDYIRISQNFACDDLDETIETVKEQLEASDPETRIYLLGTGRVKAGLIPQLPAIKQAIYIDIGVGIDALAGVIDTERPYAKNWINHKLRDFDYTTIDMLGYSIACDENCILVD